MKFEFHLYVHSDSDISARLDRFENTLREMKSMADDQKTQLDALISTIKTGISGLADTLTTTAADLQAAVRDFAAKIAAIPNAPDLSSELSDLGAIADAVVGVKTKVVDIDTAIKTADPGPTEPIPPVEPIEPPA